jgi:hypothetical protein
MMSPLVVDTEPMQPMWPTLRPTATVRAEKSKPTFVVDLDRRRMAANAAVRELQSSARSAENLQSLRAVLIETLAAIAVECHGVARDCRRGCIPTYPCDEGALRIAVARGAAKSTTLDESTMSLISQPAVELMDAPWCEGGLTPGDRPGSAYRKLRGLYALSSHVSRLLRWIDSLHHLQTHTNDERVRAVDEYSALLAEERSFRQRLRLQWGPKYIEAARATYAILSMLKSGTLSTLNHAEQISNAARFLKVDQKELLAAPLTHLEAVKVALEARGIRAHTIDCATAAFTTFEPEAAATDGDEVMPVDPLTVPAMPTREDDAAVAERKLSGWRRGFGSASASVDGPPPPMSTSALAERRESDSILTNNTGGTLVVVAENAEVSEGPSATAAADEAILVERLKTLSPTSLAVAYVDMLPYSRALKATREKHLEVLRSQRMRVAQSPHILRGSSFGGDRVVSGGNNASSPTSQRKLTMVVQAVEALQPDWKPEYMAKSQHSHPRGGGSSIPMLDEADEEEALRSRQHARPVGENRKVPWWHFTPPAYFTGGGGEKSRPSPADPSTDGRQQQQPTQLALMPYASSQHAARIPRAPPLTTRTAADALISSARVNRLGVPHLRQGLLPSRIHLDNRTVLEATKRLDDTLGVKPRPPKLPASARALSLPSPSTRKSSGSALEASGNPIPAAAAAQDP